MDAKKVEIVYYHLKLDKEEAQQLMALVQNPLTEEDRESELRFKIFSSLQKAGCNTVEPRSSYFSHLDDDDIPF